MQTAGRFLYVGYLCQQAVEKALKAALAEQSEEHPPRIHNLVRLAENAEVFGLIEQSWPGFLVDLTPFAIEARYPEYREKMNRRLDQQEAGRLLATTGELHRWLSARIK